MCFQMQHITNTYALIFKPFPKDILTNIISPCSVLTPSECLVVSFLVASKGVGELTAILFFQFRSFL